MLYFDSSALIKIIKKEGTFLKLIDYLVSPSMLSQTRISSVLLKAEILRALHRHNVSDYQRRIGINLLNNVQLISFNDDIFNKVYNFDDQKLGTLDAFHLATAIYSNADNMVRYDAELANCCKKYNINVISPK